MAQSFEEQMKGAFDMIADRLNRDLQAYMAAAADRLSALVEAECAESATGAARDAAAEVDAAATALLQQMLDAVARLERSASLSDALQNLGAAVAPHADRSGIFLLRGQTLRLWIGSSDDGNGDDLPAELSLDESDPVAEAARLALPLTATRDGADEAGGASTPRRATAAVPLVIQSQVVAVLFAERTGNDAGVDRLGIIAELLARHAARVLESLTASRLTQLGKGHAAGTAVLSGM
ncbi:MAG: GAF domain-containing protein [Vicinamibacterales bacterium]